MIEYLLALLCGVAAGIFTGLAPGIHINLVSAVVLSLTNLFTNIISPMPLVIFIVAMSITNTFLDVIPSIYLGAPEEDTIVSVLPGHQLLMQGRGHEAVLLTLIGSASGALITIILTPILIFFLPFIHEITQPILPFIIIFISLYLIIQEEKPVIACMVFMLAGFLGYASLNLPISQPLLPLLSGLFGTSGLLLSITQKPKLPLQKISSLREIDLPKKAVLAALGKSILTSPLCTFLPGIGSGHAAILSSAGKKTNPRAFLVLIGSINTIGMGISFITLYIINRTRTGAAVAISQILGELMPAHLIIIILTILLTSAIVAPITIFISKRASYHITKVSYSKVSLIIIFIIIFITFLMSHTKGMVVLLVSTALGIFAVQTRVRRINLMGVLLFPTILFYF